MRGRQDADRGIQKIANPITAGPLGRADLVDAYSKQISPFCYPGLAFLSFLATDSGGVWLGISFFVQEQPGWRKPPP
jgi:hypothetical protein